MVSALVAAAAMGFFTEMSAAEGANQAVAGQLFDIAQLDKKPVVKVSVPPRYPAALREQGIQGQALIEFVVDNNGAVRDASVVRFTEEAFAEAALAAVSKWQFRPGEKNGEPVATKMQVPIVFALNQKG